MVLRILSWVVGLYSPANEADSASKEFIVLLDCFRQVVYVISQKHSHSHNSKWLYRIPDYYSVQRTMVLC